MSIPIGGRLIKAFAGKGLADGNDLFSNVYTVETNADGSFTLRYKDVDGNDQSVLISQSLLATTPADFNDVSNGVFIGTMSTLNSPFMPGQSQQAGTVISVQDDNAQIREQFGFNASETYHRKFTYPVPPATQGSWSAWTNHAYSLPTASASVLGGVKVGNNLEIDSSSVLTAKAPTSTVIGAVRAGNNIEITSAGVVTTKVATSTVPGAVIAGTALNQQQDGTVNANIATASSVGVIKAGSGMTIDSEGRADITVGTRFLNRVPLGLGATQNTGITVSNSDSATETGDAVSRTFAVQGSAAVSPASPSNIKDITLKLAPSTFATPQANAGLQAQKLYRASFEGNAVFSSARTTAGYVMLFALMKVTETRTNAFVTSVGALIDYKSVSANETYFKEVPLSLFNYDRVFGSSKSVLTALSIELSFYTITQSSASNYATDSLAALNYLKDLEKAVASPTEPTNLDDRYASVIFLKNIGATFKQ